MELDKRLEAIESREDLAEFIDELLAGFEADPSKWENGTLQSFLEAMSAWIRSMDRAYINTGRKVPTSPEWKTIAEIVFASSIYE